MRPGSDGESRCSLLLPNDSRIIGLPESEDSIPGSPKKDCSSSTKLPASPTISLLRLRPLLAAAVGALWLMSTPYGRSGLFYREWSENRQLRRMASDPGDCRRMLRHPRCRNLREVLLVHSRRGKPLRRVRAVPGRRDLKPRTCWVIATSAGSRSMEDAPKKPSTPRV